MALRGLKTRAALAMLALTPGAAAPRAALAAALWPEAPADRRRVSLRQTLRALNAAFAEAGFDGLEAGRDALRLDAARLDSDVEAVLRCARRGAAHPALLAGRDPFATLCGDSVMASAAFAAVVAERASALRRRAARDLDAALAAAADPTNARDLAQALLALDPCDERAARRLMQAHAALGEPLRALAAYDALWARLDAEQDAEPSEETQRLAARLAAGSGRAAPAAPRPATRRRIVLLPPFEAEPGAPGGARAAAAARLEIAGALGGFEPWVVALGDPGAPAPAADYRARGAVVAEADAGALLLTLETSPDRRLIAAARARLGEKAAPGRAAARLAAALARDLAAEEARAAQGLSDAALEPAARPFRARALAEALRPETLSRARELAAAPGGPSGPSAAAGARESALAPALAGRPPAGAEIAAAIEMAQSAVDADPLSPEARLALGWALLMEWRCDDAAEAFALAAHLNPADPACLREGALGLALAGRREAAQAQAAEAAALEAAAAPGARALAAMTAFALGDDGPARALPEAGAPPLALAWRAAALAAAGETAAAGAAARALLRAAPIDPGDAARALPMADAARRAALEEGLRAAFEAAARG